VTVDSGFCIKCVPSTAEAADWGPRPAETKTRSQNHRCDQCGADVPAESKGCARCGLQADRPAAEAGLLDPVWAKLDGYASLDKLEGFSLREMFSEVLKHRPADEIDDYFHVGSRVSTPHILDVCTSWPKPWFFARVLFFIALIYIGQLFVLTQYRNPLILPGMMMMGSLAVPLATAFLFFELNTPRNVSFHRVLMLVCKGGMLSILISVAGFDMSKLHLFFGAPAAGVVEETGKLLAVVLVAGRGNKRFILNGCLIGAAVGAGFEAFESAGYAFFALLQGNVDAMVNSILLRGVVAPFGHVTWTAITAGALWRASARHESKWSALFDRAFVRTLALAMVLHATWNFAVGIGGIVALVGVVSVAAATWYVAFGVVQQGLKQVEAAQALTRREQNDQLGAMSANPHAA
jgi:RsiW-degrading membrane proteinase PrsW (M82 family)